MKQQTAIEWLLNEFQEAHKDFGGLDLQWLNKFEKAKEMEKEQIEKSFDEGWLQCNIYGLPEKSRKHFKTATDYFDFTYTQSSE